MTAWRSLKPKWELRVVLLDFRSKGRKPPAKPGNIGPQDSAACQVVHRPPVCRGIRRWSLSLTGGVKSIRKGCGEGLLGAIRVIHGMHGKARSWADRLLLKFPFSN